MTVWDEPGNEATATDAAFWETGLLHREDWTGQWIGGPLAGGPQTSVPAPFLRGVFAPTKTVKSARLYATALGLYECFLNGQRVGEVELAPGWTDYHTRVQYQAYDVTALVQNGANVLGDGWYCGCVEWRGRQRYGDRLRFLAQVVLLNFRGWRLRRGSRDCGVAADDDPFSVFLGKQINECVRVAKLIFDRDAYRGLVGCDLCRFKAQAL